LLFATFPWTQYKSSYFLTEFPLIASVAALNACALRYWETGRVIWAAAAGIALAAALLAKVTAAGLILAGVGFILWRAVSRKSWRDLVSGGIAFMAPVLLIAGPYYVRNWPTVWETARGLASAELAAKYRLGGAWDLAPTWRFIDGLIHEYE